ncbi:MAG TPA: hypothetical protein VIO11_07860 [Candidatus Methanoperedens sp.]
MANAIRNLLDNLKIIVGSATTKQEGRVSTDYPLLDLTDAPQVKPSGYGSGADEHKVLYNYRTLSALLENAGY